MASKIFKKDTETYNNWARYVVVKHKIKYIK